MCQNHQRRSRATTSNSNDCSYSTYHNPSRHHSLKSPIRLKDCFTEISRLLQTAVGYRQPLGVRPRNCTKQHWELWHFRPFHSGKAGYHGGATYVVVS